MADAATGIPPRIRTRASLESQAPLSDLAEIAMRGDLPEPTAVRVRSIAARNSPELMPPIFDALVRLRMAGVPHEEIARRFGIHVRTVYRWWERAKPWLRERLVDLDPAEAYAERMAEFDARRARLFTLFMGTDDPKEAARLSHALDRISETSRRWMDSHGYFDLVKFGEMAGQESDRTVREARELREALDVFSDYGETADDLIEQWEPYEDGEQERQDPDPG